MTAFDELLAAFFAYLDGFGEPAANFVQAADRRMKPRHLAPESLNVVRQLDRCLELSSARSRPIIRRLIAAGDLLAWRQTYSASDFGQKFLDNYGWVELFGTRGHFENGTMAGGFLLLGPGVTYPDHHHIAEEIYIPLTGGTEWRKGEGALERRPADEVIHHPSDVNHAMHTGAEPLLALYLWRGGPLAQKSVITRPAG